MRRLWFRDLYRIDSVVGVCLVIVRALLAVGVPPRAVRACARAYISALAHEDCLR